MAYSILNYSKVFPTLGGGVSKWCAIGGSNTASHIKLQLLRSDGLSTVITNGSGNVKLDSYGTPPTTLTTGGSIYLIAYDAGGVVLAEGLFSIISYTAGVITTNMPYSASYITINICFVTDYANFRFRVEYLDGSETIASAIYTPGTNQIAWVDASPFLKDTVAITSKVIPSSGNNDVADDINSYCQLFINEVYDGPDGHFDDISEGVDIDLYVVNAANQLQNPKGISLIDKMTNNTPSQLLKFMSDTDRPTWFAGYPFHMTFIYSELMTDPLSARFEFLDINGVQLSTAVNALTDHKSYVNRVFIRSTVPAGTKTAQINIQKTTGSTAMSEVKYINYVTCNDPNIVFLKWIGPSGAWNFWLFSYNQTENFETASSQGVFSRTVDNLATAESYSEWISKEAVGELLLGAEGLSRNDMTLLKTLLSSPKVMMLMNPTTWVTDGEIYQTVKVKNGKFKIGDTRTALNSLELAIALNEINVQVN